MPPSSKINFSVKKVLEFYEENLVVLVDRSLFFKNDQFGKLERLLYFYENRYFFINKKLPKYVCSARLFKSIKDFDLNFLYNMIELFEFIDEYGFKDDLNEYIECFNSIFKYVVEHTVKLNAEIGNYRLEELSFLYDYIHHKLPANQKNKLSLAAGVMNSDDTDLLDRNSIYINKLLIHYSLKMKYGINSNMDLDIPPYYKEFPDEFNKVILSAFENAKIAFQSSNTNSFSPWIPLLSFLSSHANNDVVLSIKVFIKQSSIFDFSDFLKKLSETIDLLPLDHFDKEKWMLSMNWFKDSYAYFKSNESKITEKNQNLFNNLCIQFFSKLVGSLENGHLFEEVYLSNEKRQFLQNIISTIEFLFEYDSFLINYYCSLILPVFKNDYIYVPSSIKLAFESVYWKHGDIFEDKEKDYFDFLQRLFSSIPAREILDDSVYINCLRKWNYLSSMKDSSKRWNFFHKYIDLIKSLDFSRKILEEVIAIYFNGKPFEGKLNEADFRKLFIDDVQQYFKTSLSMTCSFSERIPIYKIIIDKYITKKEDKETYLLAINLVQSSSHANFENVFKECAENKLLLTSICQDAFFFYIGLENALELSPQGRILFAKRHYMLFECYHKNLFKIGVNVSLDSFKEIKSFLLWRDDLEYRGYYLIYETWAKIFVEKYLPLEKNLFKEAYVTLILFSNCDYLDIDPTLVDENSRFNSYIYILFRKYKDYIDKKGCLDDDLRKVFIKLYKIAIQFWEEIDFSSQNICQINFCLKEIESLFKIKGFAFKSLFKDFYPWKKYSSHDQFVQNINHLSCKRVKPLERQVLEELCRIEWSSSFQLNRVESTSFYQKLKINDLNKLFEYMILHEKAYSKNSWLIFFERVIPYLKHLNKSTNKLKNQLQSISIKYGKIFP